MSSTFIAHVTVESALPDILLPRHHHQLCLQRRTLRAGTSWWANAYRRLPAAGRGLLPSAISSSATSTAMGSAFSTTAATPSRATTSARTSQEVRVWATAAVSSIDPPGSNTIGGATAADRNVISGNVGTGIVVCEPVTTGTVILGNYIGTTSAGSLRHRQWREWRRLLLGDQNQVSRSSQPNVISGNGGNGVSISGDQNVVRNNIIGLNATFNADLGNAGHGVLVSSGTGNQIGGFGTFQIDLWERRRRRAPRRGRTPRMRSSM